MIFCLNDLNFFHDYNCFLLVFIMVFIIFNYVFLMNIFFFQKMNLCYKVVEMKCCLFPLFILILQLIPSLFLFFEMIFFFEDYFFTLKIIGHQWYWSYEYSDFFNFSFDSYMKEFEYFFLGDEMYLEVDNNLILPNNILIRFVGTSSDVIHAWSLPNFFLKMDVMSGIMSVINNNFNLLGLFFGQCSEICGVNHSFMPIVLEVVLFDFFKCML
nr:cytochrome c oxidase subunit II [Meloidogyne exigua]